MSVTTFGKATQCDGKKGFPTNSHHLDIYRCPHCGQFHLGNKPKGQGRPKPQPPAIELEF